ncbi:hypothetical protein BUALT_Bualt04G0022200 [Buddleja alternifolia]|uniref:SWIM-type domain-containing protein n=1 Tax=Buddleja alternifolia TaxID=168488 RepID=A0AAV6XTT8_9LAMI|nr:hypothetical protein BUALT_Bualt04G0022200 [Buddleja alternifolia]
MYRAKHKALQMTSGSEEEQFDLLWRFTLHLGEKTCSCRKWQLTGIPCPHAISGMYYMGYKPEDHVADCYKKSTFIRTYSHLMTPLHGPEEWPQSRMPPLQAPIKENMPGRPKKQNRIKSPQEIEEEKANQAKERAKKVVVDNVGNDTGKVGKQGVKMSCRLCGLRTHNIRTCPQNPKNQEKNEHMEVLPPNVERGEKRKRKENDSVNTSRETRRSFKVAGQDHVASTQVSVTGPAIKKRKLLVKRRKPKNPEVVPFTEVASPSKNVAKAPANSTKTKSIQTAPKTNLPQTRSKSTQASPKAT